MSEDKVIFYEFGEYRLDLLNCRLLKNGSPVQITQKSFEVLQLLIKKRSRMLRKEELLTTVWDDCYVEEATLTQHIYMLRKVLQQNGKVYIETIPKNGYRFVAQVEEIIRQNEDLAQTQPLKNVPASESESERFENISKFDASFPTKQTAPMDRQNKFLSRRNIFVFTTICLLLSALAVYVFTNKINRPPPTDSSEISSLAVLPFQHIAQEKDEKLGLGMADVLITKLGNVETLKVLPTSAVIRYASSDFSDLTEVGKNLGVDAVLTGTIQRDGDAIRVTIQFYSIEKQDFIWSEKFDESFSNIFLLQDSISERISKELAVRIKGYSHTPSDKQYTESVEAHQAYSMGLYHWNSRTEDGLKKAVAHFQTAIEKDGNFALAYAFLADTYALIGYYRMDFLSKKEAAENARIMANKALDLDSRCSEAMTALATINSGENREESLNLLKKAIELKPNYIAAHQRIAWMYAGEGDFEKALAEMKIAQNLDPLSPITNIALAQLLNLTRKPDEAMIYARRVLELNSDDEDAKLIIAASLEQKGRLNEAEKQVNEILRANEHNGEAEAFLSRIYAKSGETEKAQNILNRLAGGKKSGVLAYDIAGVYTALGDHEEAIKWLRKNLKDSPQIYFFIKSDYNFDPLRQHPEFNDLTN